jgi:hypothetical protein
VHEYPAANSTYNYTYLLNTEEMTYDAGTAWCNDRGATPVVYRDQGEQEDVERHFIEESQLLIPYKITYWIGATAAASGDNAWPNFKSASAAPSKCVVPAACLVAWMDEPCH